MVSHQVIIFFSFKQIADAFLFAESVFFCVSKILNPLKRVRFGRRGTFQILLRFFLEDPMSLALWLAPEQHNRISEAMTLCYWGDWIPNLGCPNPPKIYEARPEDHVVWDKGQVDRWLVMGGVSKTLDPQTLAHCQQHGRSHYCLKVKFPVSLAGVGKGRWVKIKLVL